MCDAKVQAAKDLSRDWKSRRRESRNNTLFSLVAWQQSAGCPNPLNGVHSTHCEFG
jgi:hypothetical protein